MADEQTVPPGSVVITPEAQYRENSERYGRIEATMTEISAKLHPMLEKVGEHDAYLNSLRDAGLPQRFLTMEADVNTLKGNWKYALGIGAAVVFLAGLLGSLLPKLF